MDALIKITSPAPIMSKAQYSGYTGRHKKSHRGDLICLTTRGGQRYLKLAGKRCEEYIASPYQKAIPDRFLLPSRSFQAVSVSAYQLTASRCRISITWLVSDVRARIKQTYVMGIRSGRPTRIVNRRCILLTSPVRQRAIAWGLPSSMTIRSLVTAIVYLFTTRDMSRFQGVAMKVAK